MATADVCVKGNFCISFVMLAQCGESGLYLEHHNASFIYSDSVSYCTWSRCAFYNILNHCSVILRQTITNVAPPPGLWLDSWLVRRRVVSGVAGAGFGVMDHLLSGHRAAEEAWFCSYSHFASLLSADEQSGDSHHHGDEEHAGADAFDHTAQRLCRTQTFSHQRASHFALHPPRPHSEHVKHAGLDEASECVRCFVLTSLCDHRQRQERVGEQRRAVGDGEVASVVIKQLSERSDAEPADRTQGTLHFNIAELIFQSNINRSS